MAHHKSTDPDIFILPDVGEGVHEAELIKWCVVVGQSVEENQTLVELNTDKALVEIPSPRPGVISQLHGTVGEILKVGNPLVSYEAGAGGKSKSKAPAPARASANGSSSNGTHPAESSATPSGTGCDMGTQISEHVPTSVSEVVHEDAGTVVGSLSANPGVEAAPGKVLATPAVRRLARDMGVDISLLQGTGMAGRVTEKDVRAAQTVQGKPQVRTSAPASSQPGARPQATPAPTARTETRRPLPTQRTEPAPSPQMPSRGSSAAAPAAPYPNYPPPQYPQLSPPHYPPHYPPQGFPPAPAYAFPPQYAPYPYAPYPPPPPYPYYAMPYPGPAHGYPPPMPPYGYPGAGGAAPTGVPHLPGYTPAQGGRPIPDPAQKSLTGAGGAAESKIPFRGIRRNIATRLRESVNTAVHFTVMDEADVTALDQFRRELAAQSGEKISFLPFVCAAVCKALGGRFGAMNARVDDAAQEIVQYAAVHLGIATDTDNGLMVPVIRDADRLDVVGLARGIAHAAGSARDRTATRDSLMGSTFTISNVGSHAGKFATPVINYPEVGILAVGRVFDSVMVRDGQAAIGKSLPLSLACDHRVVDGATAALALAEIVRLLQEPEAL
ncbi:MAG: 2-oxo acid dehydrogenase subunit E2 [Pyrinomonadaceae bacterium]|nr:2-oxo acid dehydrogenase subunit E2 [Phycisphaerales bacterium]